MNLQIRKLNFIEEYLRITNENILDVLETVLKKEKTKAISAQIKPMTLQDLKIKLDRSEQDIKNGKIYSQEEVEQILKNTNKKF